jgi:integrase
MSPLRGSLAEYLAVRRALDCKLAEAERLLLQFLGYLEARGEERITIEHALARRPCPGRRRAGAQRLQTVRRFARYLHAADREVQVPAGMLRGRSRRAILYSDEEIAALIVAAETLGALGAAHRAATFQTLIVLLAVTGMRIGEAIELDRDDLDCEHGS